MNIWNLSLLIGALIAAGFSIRNPRGLLWICAGAVDYLVSVLYWRTGLPYGEAVAGMCDAAVCLSIYLAYRETWELIVYRLFQVSLAVNIFFLAGNLDLSFTIPFTSVVLYVPRVDQDTYATVLELLNGLFLLLIGGMGVAEFVGAPIAAAHRPAGRLRGALRALRTPRTAPPFTQV